MKKAKLIKKEKWLELQTVATSSKPQSSSVQGAVQVVRTWIKEQRVSPQQARQMFAALFPQPQS